MSEALSRYNDLRSSLIMSDKGGVNPPVIDDVENYKATVGKNALEGVGSMFVGSSAATGIKALMKSKNLQKIGIEDGDVEDVVAQAQNGDLTQAAGGALRAGINALNRNLQGLTRSATTGIEDEAGARVGGYLNAMRNSPLTQNNPLEQLGNVTRSGQDPANIATADPVEQAPSSGGAVVQSADGSARIGQATEEPARPPPAQAAPAEPTAEEQVVNPTAPAKVGTLEDASVDADEGVSVASKVLKGIDTAEEVSAAADVDPANLLVTGALGLASIIGGLFVKTHHIRNVAPPSQVAANYAAQLL